MGLFLFLIVIIVSFIVIKIGAVAFEITGLNSKQARFQALSVFTGTGFTTRESELIAVHDQRRKIASVLMVLGNLGVVTMIAALVNSISIGPSSPIFIMPAMEENMPRFLIPYVNFTIVVLFLLFVYMVITKTKIMDYVMKKAKKEMVDKKIIKSVSFEEFLMTSGGYGVSQIRISKNNPLLGKTIMESDLKQKDILVLSVEKGSEHLTNPSAAIKIELGDRLICFGKFENIRKIAYAAEDRGNDYN
ncbi:MAG: TrkA C-terminal domain-containing protein [Candidatus Omnitrophica bacterium]|nr:TrkA C-terminal domain-containing protein [Candidatus Omnitrophota bacterium]